MSEVSYKSVDKSSKVFYGYRQNISFYENLELTNYEDFAKASGLADREDVLALLPYLSQAKSILEVGAGFGRAVDALLCFCPTAKITALEVCSHMCHFMQRRYIDDFNVRVIQADFLGSSLTHHSFDLVTMFWSTLTSFSIEEQQRCFHRMAKLLTENGRFAVDLFESSHCKQHQGLKKSLTKNGIFTTEVLGHRVCGWFMPDEDLKTMAQKAGLKLSEQIRYQANDVQRRFLIFTRI
jgi:ubiquinone/menaquinone biosynthesis C-methylase UbiE